jgi:hypothetical protein
MQIGNSKVKVAKFKAQDSSGKASSSSGTKKFPSLMDSSHSALFRNDVSIRVVGRFVDASGKHIASYFLN